MKNLMKFALIATVFVSNLAFAGTKALGFEIGVSTLEEVTANLKAQTRVEDAGINSYSSGRMLRTSGAGFSIDGLQRVTFVFDDKNKLAAILMMIGKHRFDPVLKSLSTKYKVSSKQIPLVGNKFASFKTSDSVIELDAPHLSSEMELRYVKIELMNKFVRQSQQEKNEKKIRENSQL